MTMLIFSRRALQQRLHTLASVLSPDVHQRLIARLERPGRDRLAAMWETVFLSALSSVAPLRHEDQLADGRKPDFTLSYAHGNVKVDIVGDITTVSDKGLHQNNPAGQFGQIFVRLAQNTISTQITSTTTLREGALGNMGIRARRCSCPIEISLLPSWHSILNLSFGA